LIHHYWDKTAGRMELAGRFFGDIEVDSAIRELHYSYGGSWYMDRIEATYGWVQHRLIPRKKVVASLREWAMLPGDNCCIVSEFDNPFFEQGKDTLVLRSREFVSDY
jgi:hypothetical protein